MNFTLQFHMESDWHVGAGFGRPGNVDRLLIRDADELPYLPAKTLRGMWRDAAERLARGLDEGEPAGPWQQLVDDIFGSQPQLSRVGDPSGYHTDPRNRPRETVLRVGPARLPEGLRGRLKGKGRERIALRAAVSLVKPGVAIDSKSGRAKDDHLRFEEMGRAGMTLTATVTFDAERFGGAGSPRYAAARALVLAATKLITRIGGKRRRGAGKCWVVVDGADVAVAIHFLKENLAPPAASTETSGESTSHIPFGSTSASTDWISIPLKVTLRGPVVVPARTVGNVVQTLDFVPGTYFLSHVTRVFHQFGLDARAAIARGDIRVLNALIDVNGRRGLPVPMNLFTPKGKDFDEAANRFLTGPDGGQDKQLREGYIEHARLDGEVGTLKKVPKTVGTHNVIEDGSQRPTTAVGGVYSFEAIAQTDEDQDVVLRTELRIRSGLLSQSTDWRKLDGRVRLGVSKKDDYGEAELEAGTPVPLLNAPCLRDDGLFVWLQSDVLLRGDGLQPEPTVGSLADELGKRLAVQLKAERCFARVRRTESWHTGWGLPRPSLVGLQAGSCMKFTVSGNVDPARLTEIEVSGLGERTAEGFGQVAFNHPLLADLKTTRWKPAGGTEVHTGSAMRAPDETPDTDGQTAGQIEQAAWRESIRSAALAATATYEQRTALFNWQMTKPNMSQLGGFRSAVQFLLSESDRERVLGWIVAVGRNRKRRDKWPDGSLTMIEELLATPGRVWAVLRTDTTTSALKHIPWPTIRPGRELALEKELWALAVRSLFDAAIRAHKRAGEGARGLNNGA